MALFEKKALALQLRKEGLSIKDITHKLGVAKSSVSVWCREIILTTQQKESLRTKGIERGHKGRLIGAEVNRQKRLTAIADAKAIADGEIGKISKENLLYLSVGLYWAEGTKQGASFIFVNSDPAMVRIMQVFLTTQLGILPEDISITIQINEVHKYRMPEIVSFWSKTLKMPKGQFRSPYYILVKPKKVYENHNSYYGIVRLRVARSSFLQYKMLGYIEAVRRQLMLV